MSLLFMDGFGHVLNDYLKTAKYDTPASVFVYYAGIGYDGGWGARSNATTGTLFNQSKALANSDQTLIFGYRLKFYGMGGGSQFLYLGPVSFAPTTAGLLIYVSGTLIHTDTSGMFVVDEWAYWEFKVYSHDTEGTIEVRKDGVTVISLTGLDTKGTTTTDFINVVHFRQYYGTTTGYDVDDLYICNGEGEECNDFLGDVTVDTIYPTSDGSVGNFTPSTGTDHFAVVDDPQLDSGSDYLTSTTDGDKELFGMTEIDSDKVVYGVQLISYVKTPTRGSMKAVPLIKSGTSPAETEGTVQGVSQSSQALMSIFEKEPTDDVAWTVAKINSAEFGIKVQS